MHNQFTQAEGVANLDQVPDAGALIAIGFAKPGEEPVVTHVTSRSGPRIGRTAFR